MNKKETSSGDIAWQFAIALVPLSLAFFWGAILGKQGIENLEPQLRKEKMAICEMHGCTHSQTELHVNQGIEEFNKLKKLNGTIQAVRQSFDNYKELHNEE